MNAPIAYEASDEERQNALSAVGIRNLVGYLGILLPVLCVMSRLVTGNDWLPSVSHYYYTLVHGPFVAILCGLAMVLFVYRGYDKWDARATTIAGLAAAGVGLFPTAIGEGLLWPGNARGLKPIDDLLLRSHPISGTIHNVSAVILFLMFFFISAFLFTRTPKSDGKPPTFGEFWETVKKTWFFLRKPPPSDDPVVLDKEKKRERENATHRRCAWLILLSLIGAIFSRATDIPPPWFALFETAAILSFAWSWLTKNRKDGNALTAIVNDARVVAARVTKSPVVQMKT